MSADGDGVRRMHPGGAGSTDQLTAPHTHTHIVFCPARLAVECLRHLMAELAALPSEEQPVLFAVDDYNALHAPTDYGEYSHVRRGRYFMGDANRLMGGAPQRKREDGKC